MSNKDYETGGKTVQVFQSVFFVRNLGGEFHNYLNIIRGLK